MIDEKYIDLNITEKYICLFIDVDDISTEGFERAQEILDSYMKDPKWKLVGVLNLDTGELLYYPKSDFTRDGKYWTNKNGVTLDLNEYDVELHVVENPDDIQWERAQTNLEN